MCSSRGNEVFVLRGLIGICFCIDEKHRSRDQADAKFALLKYRRQISNMCIYIMPPIFCSFKFLLRTLAHGELHRFVKDWTE
jgi:hypothetical protein